MIFGKASRDIYGYTIPVPPHTPYQWWAWRPVRLMTGEWAWRETVVVHDFYSPDVDPDAPHNVFTGWCYRRPNFRDG